MATKKCPRCKVRVDPVKDKSKARWQWSKSKKKGPTYVCHACESELTAKEKGTPVVYTMNQDIYPPNHEQIRLGLKSKKSKRKKKLCSQCKEVTFLIGVLVYGDQPRGPLVCSNKCKLRRRKQDREEAAA